MVSGTHLVSQVLLGCVIIKSFETDYLQFLPLNFLGDPWRPSKEVIGELERQLAEAPVLGPADGAVSLENLAQQGRV